MKRGNRGKSEASPEYKKGKSVPSGIVANKPEFKKEKPKSSVDGALLELKNKIPRRFTSRKVSPRTRLKQKFFETKGKSNKKNLADNLTVEEEEEEVIIYVRKDEESGELSTTYRMGECYPGINKHLDAGVEFALRSFDMRGDLAQNLMDRAAIEFLQALRTMERGGEEEIKIRNVIERFTKKLDQIQGRTGATGDTIADKPLSKLITTNANVDTKTTPVAIKQKRTKKGHKRSKSDWSQSSILEGRPKSPRTPASPVVNAVVALPSDFTYGVVIEEKSDETENCSSVDTKSDSDSDYRERSGSLYSTDLNLLTGSLSIEGS
eukprot:TRINITY_DN788_c0_g3_i1.p1 TRINITY_DN788_c0_g3~~TRINITY_DN788_c0_g3_i1.p1  ORF type:complete len:322 (-),score=60.56 TRINITY_DN788_c0_g3_i1:408-1373(-)